jgi:hypothetical protein
VRHLFDETAAAAVLVEWQLILCPSFGDPEQSQIENLEDLRGLRCESNDPYDGSREKIENDGPEVR